MTAPANELAVLAWPLENIGEALVALARNSRLIAVATAAARHPPIENPAALDRWVAMAGEHLGVSIESTIALYGEIDAALAAVHPALIRIAGRVLVVLRRRRGDLVCLRRDGLIARISRQTVARALRANYEQPHRDRISELLVDLQLAGAARDRAAVGMFNKLLATTSVMHAWQVRLPSGASFVAQLRAAGLFRIGATLLVAHALQYGLFLLSWWAIGRAILNGHMESGWLSGWALLLLGSIPLVMLSTGFQGRLAVGIGALLRRRLLAGALALPPAILNRDGIGRLLGRTIEADSLERLALSGGFLSALALLELAFAIPVLAAGAGGGLHAALLAIWLVFTGVLGARLARSRARWTDTRLVLTTLTTEHIVGHRTRLAQERPDRWHEREDDALSRYFECSVALDRRALALLVLVPRGWLLAGLAALAAPFIASADTNSLSVGIGAVILAWRSFARLSTGIDQLASAHIAWRRVAPLFYAAARDTASGANVVGDATAPEHPMAPQVKQAEPILEVVDVSFRHAGRTNDVLSGCSFVVRAGDRLLIQGPSGGGKSTLVSLLAGMQLPTSGLLLARGLDMTCLGEAGWRSRVSAAPQFHENHILTESFAFNILMGRTWPPRPEDLEQARVICTELGLGPLLSSMPAGMHQMVGESGWRLSHGEQSRLFIARALLQRSDVVILDESLAALDPENMMRALRCLRARATSLIVVAHP